jgi:hypothetical protein
MAHISLEDRAIEALDLALLQTDPISRMMLIERALRLHRQSMEARDRQPANDCASVEEASPRPH